MKISTKCKYYLELLQLQIAHIDNIFKFIWCRFKIDYPYLYFLLYMPFITNLRGVTTPFLWSLFLSAIIKPRATHPTCL